MKKLVCLLLALLMITSVLLVACNDKKEEGDDTKDNLLFPEQTTTEGTTTEAATTEPTNWEFTDVDEMVYVKNCLKVNIRSTPSWASKDNIVGTLEFGDERTYKRVKYNSVWSGIEVEGEICYVRSEFLTTEDGFVVFEDADKIIYANNTVSDSGVFVYNFTDTAANDAKWGVVKHGAELHVTAVSKNGKWYRIEFSYTDKDGKTVEAKNLYIYNGKYVSETKPADTSAAQ